MKKVLGLVASPRRAGNSEIIVKEMMNVLPASWNKRMLRLTDLKIDLCKACYACLPQEKRCVLDDDLNFFLDAIKETDKVIIAAPVYFLGQHTTLKLINDRMISIQNNTREYATGKQCVIAVPHTVPCWEGYGREATMHFARFLNLNVTGNIVLQSMLPGDVVNEDCLNKIRTLAQSLVDDTTVDFQDEEKVYCPDCGSSFLQIFHKGAWRCVMCDAEGSFSATSGKFTLSQKPKSVKRFTPEGMIEHGHTLDAVKNEYILRRGEVASIQSPYKKIDIWLK
jgi:ribosomal protein L37AE/L43A